MNLLLINITTLKYEFNIDNYFKKKKLKIKKKKKFYYYLI